MKLGMVMGQCDSCKGVGRVKKPEPIIEKVLSSGLIPHLIEEAKKDFESKQEKEAITYGKKKGK